jgi:protein-L-isoaspartate(D-aspartate) O-methyltransferase
LLWPGGLFQGGGNFGAPQLLSIAGAIRRATEPITAHVDVVDLDAERAFGPVDLRKIASGGYDLVGISCYSSYDLLKVEAIATELRKHLPKAWFVCGGYHASARPNEIGDPFDFVVVGDGETPMARLASALITGKRPLVRVLGPESVPDPNDLPPYDWSLLERYRPIARKVASQAEIYLSRGCPYDCAFCMERAKRDVSWRALEPERAVEEMHALDRFLDLSRFTLFIADALFGMKAAWRKEFLSRLAARPIRARKTWLLIRIDLIDEEDFALMARANVSPGFGLESGDPEHLRRIRKAGKLNDMLEKMFRIASWARKHHVPFGANVIVGHPGETEASLRTSADYLDRLFVREGDRTMGFLSVDPFRLYPGSPIDEERAQWEAETGMKVHRYPWWQDGDQEFLSEWVDPSGSLDYDRTRTLERELFHPIVRAIPARFGYEGPARDYFLRAIDDQVKLTQPKRRLHQRALRHLWGGLLEQATPHPVDDVELRVAARERREETIDPRFPAHLREALLAIPREAFVRPSELEACAEDKALPLDDSGSATISAMHAYALSFAALELGPGDALVELGGGSGYGACVAGEVVGPRGRVLSLEWDAALAAWGEENVRRVAKGNVVFGQGDAHDVDRWRGATKVSVAFAVTEIPESWIEALAPGGALIAPVGARAQTQTLTLVRKDAQGRVTREEKQKVIYVPDRGRAIGSLT